MNFQMVVNRVNLPVPSKAFHKVFFSMKLRKNCHVQFARHSCGMGYDKKGDDDDEY